jgi:hypothetical protein
MSDRSVLREAVKALFPSKVHPQFGNVPDGQLLPWTFVLISIPSPRARRMAGAPATYRVVIKARCATSNDTDTGRYARNVQGALEGKRVTAAGWQCSPIQQLTDDPQVYQDTDTKTAQGLRPIVAALDFEFFATERTI